MRQGQNKSSKPHSGRRFAVVGAVATILYLLGFYYRLDYSAHLLVGFGLAGILWAFTAQTAWQMQARCTLVIGAVLAIGVVGELTVFGPEFDLVDVANAAIGSTVAVAALSGSEDRVMESVDIESEGVESRGAEPGHGDRIDSDYQKMPHRELILAGVVMVACGWLLRYPVADLTTEWWWRA